MPKLSREACIALLRKKSEELVAAGKPPYPKRTDFTEEEVISVKSYFGPWPRALEAAGIKEVNPERLEKKKQRRIQMKRKKTLHKIEAKRKKAAQAAEKKSGYDPSGGNAGGAE